MTSTEINDRLRMGLGYQQVGDPARACAVYSEVLESDPHRAEAFHLFGIALHQMGDHESAARAIVRAIALRPNRALSHANLAEILRALGHPDRASACRVVAARLISGGFGGLGEFDVQIQGPPWAGEAVSPKPQPPRIPPEPAASHAVAALKLRSEGDRAGAIEQLALASRLAPGFGELEANLGQFLLEDDRPQEALGHCCEAVRLSPGLPDAWNNLGNVLRALARSTEARSSYLEALRLDPDRPDALDNLGRLLLDDGWPEDALAWFRMALALEPDCAPIRQNVALALRALGRHEEAAASCEEALALDPDSVDARICLGSIRHEQGRSEDALGEYDRAARAKPGHAQAHHALGLLRAELGDLEGAEREFREVIRLPGDHARAYFELSSLLRAKLPDSDLAEIDRTLAEPSLSDARRADLHFAAGQVYDARGDHPRAAGHLHLANAARRADNARAGRRFYPEVHDQYSRELISAFSADFFARVEGIGHPSPRPVFVFGVPRSGTTLTEQILASHSKVHGAGERHFARWTLESLPTILGPNSTLADCLDRIDADAAHRLAEGHLARLREVDGEAERVVDKMPENYMYIGLIAAIFPNARFIHCRRDLRDVAVSCWATHFENLHWATDPDEIYSLMATYRMLMGHWERALPGRILDVDYEQTVADLEGTARALIDWCGLGWEPACLEFHRTRKTVRTASAAQVRRPVYRKSLERWRNYEADLGPLFERLEPLNLVAAS